MTEEATTINPTPVPNNDVDIDIGQTIKEKNAEAIAIQEQLDKQYEESRRSQNYRKLRDELIAYNPEYKEGFEKDESKTLFHYKLEPTTMWNYCKTFYDGQCSIAKYFSNTNKKKIFEEIVYADEYLPTKHRYNDLQLLQEHVESIVQFKKDQDIELQRQSISFLGAGGAFNKAKLTPSEAHKLWEKGQMNTKDLQETLDKFYTKRHGMDYVRNIRG